MLWEVKTASALVSAGACKEERRVGVDACKPVLYGKSPTPECCRRVRISHVECVCPVITPKLAALIDLNRAIRLIQGCGRMVPRNFKCGSITTPP
ncbi:Bifunctional inhibitor/plant lipid transfer protein/seed storage helical domain [Macleaya cordata]|uniref:Bifunctional inhibitor/plant lipid transfer protein/seed storage helical domain n=1 Tax=Macleaya cordata TaxID=56857 RepID=A0A200RAS3_MACCD|nr:Bifunctional inhibitor/plant lipid transfer protein/seed storage helical domain [Macleaya cordata]